jgi:hypothetical protein
MARAREVLLVGRAVPCVVLGPFDMRVGAKVATGPHADVRASRRGSGGHAKSERLFNRAQLISSLPHLSPELEPDRAITDFGAIWDGSHLSSTAPC